MSTLQRAGITRSARLPCRCRRRSPSNTTRASRNRPASSSPCVFVVHDQQRGSNLTLRPILEGRTKRNCDPSFCGTEIPNTHCLDRDPDGRRHCSAAFIVMGGGTTKCHPSATDLRGV